MPGTARRLRPREDKGSAGDLIAPEPSLSHELSYPRYLAIGKIVRPWGVRGEVKVEILTDWPE
ncbi:MAG: hypothetical protein SVX38_08475, partial [Chloroflexota bacterium]|nr:hypothetical protein [Chloroflexota bacterium]